MYDAESNNDLWRRAREAGYSSMALTTDTQLLGKREADVHNSFSLPSHLKMANLEKYMENATLDASSQSSGLQEYVKKYKNSHIDWSIIPHIQEVAQLPVSVKGIMCAEDAILALKNGTDGIYVSNHGARQLDTTPTTVEVLEEVVQAVRGLGS